jgi:hypothetical protein
LFFPLCSAFVTTFLSFFPDHRSCSDSFRGCRPEERSSIFPLSCMSCKICWLVRLAGKDLGTLFEEYTDGDVEALPSSFSSRFLFGGAGASLRLFVARPPFPPFFWLTLQDQRPPLAIGPLPPLPLPTAPVRAFVLGVAGACPPVSAGSILPD